MDPEKKEKITKFLQDQIAQVDFRIHGYVFDERDNRRPNRNCFLRLNKHLGDFLQHKSENRWVVLTGLRGAGKTTLLAQIYHEHRAADAYKLFLSVDQVTQILGVSLNEVLEVYQDLIGIAFERLEKPLLLFLDETQYDEKWGITLKSLYDRTKNIFIYATGSSALSFNSNADIARRAIFEKLYPLSFTEYLKIKDIKYEERGLAAELRKIIFESTNAEDVYNGLFRLQNRTKKYWLGIERQEIDRYVKYGSLPFMVAVKNESIVYDQIKKNMDRIINTDVAYSGNFTPDIVVKIPSILYMIADSDITNFTKIASDSGISRPKVIEIMDTIEKTETLLRIYPYGSHVKQVNKPSKYLFASSAFRAMYYNFIGSITPKDDYMGKLLEDTVGMYLTRFLAQKINVFLSYDSAEGGADFVIGFGNEKIVMEVGHGSKDFRQVGNTMRKVNAKYGLSVSMNTLRLSGDKKAVSVPLSYFLLI